MEKAQALLKFHEHIPPTGEVDYAVVENALRSTSDGRAALRYFHNLRRAGQIVARIDRATGTFFVSRQGVTGGK